MLTCRHATRIMSEGMDRPLSLGERLQLRFHLAFCRGCRAFRRQTAFLRRASRAFIRLSDDDTP
ncbi:zf-HC2 domain-containing protein [Zoogloea dura]|uniref:Zf-HC2 domain-containing protein n=1 Tax=Zoogloea dura TaxID=2728840 RepID=A0A848GAC6_9RHOO|nr:zf-HC2 domain-containing protein [Zoogloea dura]NML28320.1 zf-HC2 domain-containing protein [Zoogloea dura]